MNTRTRPDVLAQAKLASDTVFKVSRCSFVTARKAIYQLSKDWTGEQWTGLPVLTLTFGELKPFKELGFAITRASVMGAPNNLFELRRCDCSTVGFRPVMELTVCYLRVVTPDLSLCPLSSQIITNLKDAK